MSHTFRIGIMGAGARGRRVARFAKERKIEVAALADPDPQNSANTCAELKDAQTTPRLFADWQALLAANLQLDAMAITTPNYLHHTPALACMQQGIRLLLLEKPLATAEHDCAEIVRTAQATGTRIQLGFVLRSTPFYQQVRAILDSGVIGRVITIQADELASYGVTASLFRGYWRTPNVQSGGSLLEKSCHDMDLLTWFAGARPITVNSFGGCRILEPNPSLPALCRDCGLTPTCPYSAADRLKQATTDVFDREALPGQTEVDRCIYRCGGDGYDHQSVQILYENGVIANFILNFHTFGPRSGRNLHIIGTHGSLWGNYGYPELFSQVGLAEPVRHAIPNDGSGHAGGDRSHHLAFFDMLADPTIRPRATVFDGYLGAMVCFAADRSVTERRQVHLRYPAGHGIEIG